MKVAIGEQETFDPLQATKLKTVISKGEKAVAATRGGPGYSNAVQNLAKMRTARSTWPTVFSYWDKMDINQRTFLSHFYTQQALADGGPAEIMPEFKRTYELTQRMNAMKRQMLEGTQKMDAQVAKFIRDNPNSVDDLTNLAYGSTIDNYNPSKANAKPNKYYDDIWSRLPQQGKDVYTGLLKYYAGLNAYKEVLLEEDIKKLGLPLAQEQKLIGFLHLSYQKSNTIETYLPLVRDGRFQLRYKENKVPVTRFFNDIADRNTEATKIAANIGKTMEQADKDGDIEMTVAGATDSQLRSAIESNSSFLKEAYEILDKATLNAPGARDAMKDQLYQTYLAVMPEQSVRKMFIHRTGRAGFSTDLRKDLNSVGIKMANQFARLKYGRDLNKSLSTAHGQLRGNNKYVPFYDRMDTFVKEALNPTTNISGADGLGQYAGGFLPKVAMYHYLTGWKSAIVQPLDVMQRGMPVIAGKHGYVAATIELNKAMTMFSTRDGGVLEFGKYKAPTIVGGTQLSKWQTQAMQDLGDLNVFSSTLAAEVYRNVGKKVVSTDSVALANFKIAGRTLVLGGLMHHGERISREAIAFASYNLNRAKVMREGKQAGETFRDLQLRAHATAVAQARKDVENAIGNYDPTNRPMFMRGPVGRNVTMYKFLPIVTTRLLCGNFVKMLPLLNKEGKVEAARTFFGVLGTTLIMGGARALPFFGVIMAMAGAVYRWFIKDPDAPEDMKSIDFETYITRVWIPKQLGDMGLGWLADMADSGVLNKVTGWNFSDALSLNDMIFRPPEAGRTMREDMINWGIALAGPTASMILDSANAYEAWRNGDYQKALELFMPGSINNLLEARKEANTGIQNPKGATVLEGKDVTKSSTVGRAIGFRNDLGSERLEEDRKANAIVKTINNEKIDLTRRIETAFRRSMDFKGQDESGRDKYHKIFADLMLKKVPEFDKKYPEHAFDDAELSTALTNVNQSKVSSELTLGIPLDDKNFRVLSPLVKSMMEKDKRLKGTSAPTAEPPKEMSMEEVFSK
jgi:hypothetical protein